jgi:hypothetical protein
MGDLLGASGLLKASLNESHRQKLQPSSKGYVIYWNSHEKRVSKPSIFLISHLLIFSTSFFSPGPMKHPQKLLIDFFL